ncbi:MAG: hypothetical protein RLZZ198_516 [Bacteroidota bacterium]|jgi:hypothetical protein
MNKIELSIWGIRDGFEKNGMFHTHDIVALKKIQEDRFRDIAKIAGGFGFYMIHRQAGYTMISFVDTKIKEARTTNQVSRQGYVVFSLIFPSSIQLAQSPRAFLKALGQFYVDRVKDGTKNNFYAEEIQSSFSSLATKQNVSISPQKAGSYFTYYNDESQIDEFLTGDSSLANLSEWIWLFNAADAQGNSTNPSFWEGAFNVVPEYFNVHEIREKFRIEEGERAKREKERLDEQSSQAKNLQAFEAELNLLLLENKEHEAVNLWRQSPLKNSVSNTLQSRLFGIEQVNLERQAKAQKEKEDSDTLEELHRALHANNMEAALQFYRKLHNSNHLKLSEQNRINIISYEENKLQEQLRDEENKRNQRIRQEKNAKRKRVIVLASISFVVLASVLSFFTMFPAFLWDSDGDGFHTYLSDQCPEQAGKTCNGCPDADNDQIADKDDYCKTLKGLASANGCPDSDGDGIKDADDQCLTEFGTTGCKGCPDFDADNVTDSLDNCPNEKGLKQYNGCLQDPSSLARAKDKAALEAGNAVKVSGDIGNYKVAKKWLTFKDGHYEYSDYEKKKYKAVEAQEMVEILNQYYGLQGTLKKPAIVTQPPGPKPPSGGLTQAEEAELNGLIAKENSGTMLNQKERSRKETLKNKKKQLDEKK